MGLQANKHVTVTAEMPIPLNEQLEAIAESLDVTVDVIVVRAVAHFLSDGSNLTDREAVSR